MKRQTYNNIYASRTASRPSALRNDFNQNQTAQYFTTTSSNNDSPLNKTMDERRAQMRNMLRGNLHVNNSSGRDRRVASTENPSTSVRQTPQLE